MRATPVSIDLPGVNRILRRTTSSARRGPLGWIRPWAVALTLVLVAAPVGAEVDGGVRKRLAQLSEDFQSLARSVTPSVVQIYVVGYVTGGVGAPGDALLARQRSSGSGVVIDADGIIVTNHHVVAGAERVRVRLHQGETDHESILPPTGRLVEATVLGVDPETDLAVLKVPVTGLPALPFADSDEVRPGQLVFAFGSPLELENSVSMGIVSAVARQLRPEDPMIYLQTDASINPGNSGGPLVDTEGRVVGINTLIFSQSGGNEGIGFAAPSNIVRAVAQQLRVGGRVSRGEIGVHAQTLTPTLARALGLAVPHGVVLGDVRPGSPADLAGLRPLDVVRSLDGKRMENGRQLAVNVYRRRVGQSVTLTVIRAGEERSFRVPVVEREDDPARFAGLVDPDANLVLKLGVLAITVDEEVARLLPRLRIPGGVVVAASTGRPGTGMGVLLPGDVIHRVNGTDVGTLEELRDAMDALGAGDAVALHVERRGRLTLVGFELD